MSITKKVISSILAGLLTVSGTALIQARDIESTDSIVAYAKSDTYYVSKAPGGTTAYKNTSKSSGKAFNMPNGVRFSIIEDYCILGVHWAKIKRGGDYGWIDLGDTSYYNP